MCWELWAILVQPDAGTATIVNEHSLCEIVATKTGKASCSVPHWRQPVRERHRPTEFAGHEIIAPTERGGIRFRGGSATLADGHSADAKLRPFVIIPEI